MFDFCPACFFFRFAALGTTVLVPNCGRAILLPFMGAPKTAVSGPLPLAQARFLVLVACGGCQVAHSCASDDGRNRCVN